MKPLREHGPLPVRQPALALPVARLRVLRAVGRHEPVTTTELAAVLGGHENTTRQHLEALARDGFVLGEQNRGRMGRPSVAYSLSPTGLTHLAGRVASPEHNALVATLAEHLVATSADPTADALRVGLAWGRRLAGGRGRQDEPSVPVGEERVAPSGDGPAASDPVTQALDLLEGLGFSPVVSDDPPGGTAHKGTHAALLLRTCPLLDAARDRPDIVCTVHQGLMEGFLRARGTRADVVVVPFAEPTGCSATIRA